MAKKFGSKASAKCPEPTVAGGNPKVIASAKKRTSPGIIDGETISETRLDKPRRASGGSVLAPGADRSPMATAAKASGGPVTEKPKTSDEVREYPPGLALKRR
jgi:hypothetical protein